VTLYLATGNPGKVADFQGMEPALRLEILPGFASLPSIDETGDTFEANARLKAEHYSRFTPDWVVADDSGLSVDALGGAPGIYSARFAGRHGDDAANNRLLLERLRNVPEGRRGAAYICVLALARRGVTQAAFAGRVEGSVLEAPRGTQGFGYDPLFFCTEAGRGMAELDAVQKARFSHRGRAARALLEWIRSWPHPASPPPR